MPRKKTTSDEGTCDYRLYKFPVELWNIIKGESSRLKITTGQLIAHIIIEHLERTHNGEPPNPPQPDQNEQRAKGIK